MQGARSGGSSGKGGPGPSPGGGGARVRPSSTLRPSGGRRFRGRGVLLALGGALLCAIAFLAVVFLTSGVDGLVRLFTEPRLEARSGRKFTPTGAVKRYMEKLQESPPPERP